MPKNETAWKTVRIPAGVSFETFLNEFPDLSVTAKIHECHHTMTRYAIVYTNLSVVALEKKMSALARRRGVDIF